MATRRRQQLIFGQITWMLSAILLLVSFELLSLQLFFIVSVCGLLVLAGVLSSAHVTPLWYGRFKQLIVLGMVLLMAITLYRITADLPPGII